MTYTAQPNDRVNKFNQFFYDAYRTWGVFYAAAYRDLRAYAGDNWLPTERAALVQQRRMVLELNKIRRVVNLYSGYERENRMSTVVAPIEDSDENTADLLSDVMIYTYDKGSAHHVISEAFEHSLKTGLSILGIYLDYSRDKVNGDIKFYWKPFNALMLDPYFTKGISATATRPLLEIYCPESKSNACCLGLIQRRLILSPQALGTTNINTLGYIVSIILLTLPKIC